MSRRGLSNTNQRLSLALVLPRGQGSGWVHGHLQGDSRKIEILPEDLVSLTAVSASERLLKNPSTLCPGLDIRLVRCWGPVSYTHLRAHET